MDRGARIVRENNPREHATILSIITFFFTYGLFKKGNKKELEDTDVYEILPSLSSEKLGNKIEEVWLNEVKTKSNPSLLVAIFTCFGKKYIVLGIVQLFVKLSFTFLLPYSLGKFVAFFETGQTTITKGDLFEYAGLVFGLNLINTIYNHNYQQLVTEHGLKIKTALSAMIYRNALKLNQSSLSSITTGNIITLITKDISAFENVVIFLNDMFIGFLQTVIIAYIIYLRIGWSVFPGIAIFLLSIPLQVYIGKATSIRRVLSAKKTDERLQQITEVLSTIKSIKMFTWEKFFEKRINSSRKKEIDNLATVFYMKCIVLISGTLVSSLSFFLLIMTYVWTGNYIQAETVYFIQSCFSTLRSYVTISIPYGIVQCAEASASLKRIQEFLKLDNYVHYKSPTTREPRLTLKHISTRIKETTILKDISLDVEKGLLLISGNVGSGKSSVLKVILGEYPIDEGELIVNGSISYACQDPWLFPSSIRQNILFGQPFDVTRYNEVINVCALNFDLNRLEKGDQTIIGDKAINLSKGQQARINLARAVYKNSDIYLLDDCFSSLDNQVNMYVYKKCIMDFLKDRIVIFVTNNINHMKLSHKTRTLFIKDGATLSLDQQEKSLDKRITYFIDYVNYEEEAELNEVNENCTADENIKLLETYKDQNKNDFYHEKKQPGKVDIRVYIKYYKYFGGYLVVLFVVLVFIFSTIALSYAEKLVSKWVNIEPTVSSLRNANMMNTTLYIEAVDERNHILNLYCIMVLAGVSLVAFRTYLNFIFTLRVSKKLHKMLVHSVVNASMVFFDKHYIGNIVNRFSKDFNTIDECLPISVYEILRCTLMFIGIIYLIASVNLFFLIPTGMLLVKLYLIRRFYITPGRAIKRLESATRSPMIGYLNASLEGIATVRAFEKQLLLRQEFDKHQDFYTSAYYMGLCTSRAFAFTLDLVSIAFIGSIIVKFILFNTDSKAGDVGLAISQAMMLTGLLQWAVRQYSDIENNMTAVERVFEYTDVRGEPNTGRVEQNWPKKGKIQFKDVCMSYTTAKEHVLKNLNFTIDPLSKIGIVGRTGAGKSSIISSIFRLYDFNGQILIDNIDTKTLSLKFLRSNIAIIPQDPILFSGTIRSNIDPETKYSDEVLWSALEKVNLKHTFSSLHEQIHDNGSSYSSGQRQLICLARALVTQNKIIILDEATANMDPDTCLQLQTTIASNFAHCTVLTIAHKMNTVSKSNKVMVVKNGEVLEFDTPENLQNNKGSIYYDMLKQSGMDIIG